MLSQLVLQLFLLLLLFCLPGVSWPDLPPQISHPTDLQPSFADDILSRTLGLQSNLRVAHWLFPDAAHAQTPAWIGLLEVPWIGLLEVASAFLALCRSLPLSVLFYSEALSAQKAARASVLRLPWLRVSPHDARQLRT